MGTSAELECRFVAIPEAEVQWFHNKNLLPPNDARVSIMHQVSKKLCCRHRIVSIVIELCQNVYSIFNGIHTYWRFRVGLASICIVPPSATVSGHIFGKVDSFVFENTYSQIDD